MVKVKFKKLNSEAIVPSYGSKCAAGADLYACTEGETVIFEWNFIKIYAEGLYAALFIMIRITALIVRSTVQN